MRRQEQHLDLLPPATEDFLTKCIGMGPATVSTDRSAQNSIQSTHFGAFENGIAPVGFLVLEPKVQIGDDTDGGDDDTRNDACD